MLDTVVLLVAFGTAAFIGGTLRGLLAQWFPLYVGTFVANILAAFAAGMAIGFSMALDDTGAANFLKPVIAMGFAGALSTWSTLASELASLIKTKKWRKLSMYLGLTLALGLIFAHRGIVSALRIYNA